MPESAVKRDQGAAEREVVLTLPGDLPQAALEGICEYIDCWEKRFTGTMATEFTEGVPVLIRRTDTKRLGKLNGSSRSTGHP